MKLTKRQFLKLGFGGTAAVVLGPMIRPTALLADAPVMPSNYPESEIHSFWMKLTYNGGRESRKTRRNLGMALRNLGAARGKGHGYQFTLCFDRAVEKEFRRWQATGSKPGSVFALVQRLYDHHIYDCLGRPGGYALFGTLFSILRGRDGTQLGQAAHESYLAYRAAAIRYKDSKSSPNDPKAKETARAIRASQLQIWRRDFIRLVDVYVSRKRPLAPGFPLQQEWLEGYDISPRAAAADADDNLAISQINSEIVVSWKGEKKLQKAPTLAGPWRDTRRSDPAGFEPTRQKQFFRAIQD